MARLDVIEGKHLWTSVAILQQRCTRWMLERHGRKPIFIGHRDVKDYADALQLPSNFTLNFRPRIEGEMDIMLFGSFVRDIMESRFWPKGNYRIWTLCSTAQDVCSGLLGLGSRYVGVVPRYELFPVKENPKPFPKLNEEWTLVYSGRLSFTKNFHFCLWVTSYLQTHFGLPVKLECYGPFDNMGLMEHGITYENFMQMVWYWCAKLEWTKPPVFHGNLAYDKWFMTRVKNPVIINLSHHLMDDFGVSVAQAQSAGWPCILSDSGGHRDVNGPNILKVSPLITDCDVASEHKLSQNAMKVASLIYQRVKSNRPCRPAAVKKECVKSSQPDVITHEQLKKIRIRTTKKYSTAISDWTSLRFGQFPRTKLGKSFFRRYRRHFSALPRRPNGKDL